jgi:hypothetical protein
VGVAGGRRVATGDVPSFCCLSQTNAIVMKLQSLQSQFLLSATHGFVMQNNEMGTVPY